MNKKCPCNKETLFSFYTELGEDNQMAVLCFNLTQMEKAEESPDHVFLEEAKSLFECNLKGKFIEGTKKKYTWKKIVENVF